MDQSPLKGTWERGRHLVCLPEGSKKQHGHTIAQPESTFTDAVKSDRDRIIQHRSGKNASIRTVSWAEGWEPACWLPKTDLNPLDKYSIFISFCKFIRTHARNVAKILLVATPDLRAAAKWISHRSKCTAAFRRNNLFSWQNTIWRICYSLVSSCLLIHGWINLDTYNNGSFCTSVFVVLERIVCNRNGFSRSFAVCNLGCMERKSAEFSRWRTDAFWDTENEWRRTTFASHSKILWDNVWFLHCYRIPGSVIL